MNIFGEKRFIFQHTPTRSSVESFEEEATKYEPINAKVEFSTNAQTNIKQLAQKAFPKNTSEQVRYAAKIEASLNKYVAEGENINTLWAHLKSEKCQTTAIMDGDLRFFAGPKGENELDIADFLKPLDIVAKPQKTRLKFEVKETKTKMDFRKEREKFLAEMQKQHPELPDLPENPDITKSKYA